MSKRVVIADDHASIRLGYRVFLDRLGMNVVAEAADTDEAIAMVGQTPCELLVTDFIMPGMGEQDGFQYLSTIRERRPLLPIVVVTMVSRRGCLQRIHAAGGVAVVHKSEPLDCLFVAAHRVITGRTYVSPSLRHMFGTEAQDATPLVNADVQLLTARERCVLEQLGRGLSVSATALALGRSVTTVSSQKRALMAKLSLRDDQDIVQYARDMFRWQATEV